MGVNRENSSRNTYLLSVSCTGGAANFRPRISFSGDWLPKIGFIPGALIQALPEPDGMVFNLVNENIGAYSDLFRSTQALGGGLIRVYMGNGETHTCPTFVTSGQYIYGGGLQQGDPLIVKYDYGVIRVRKIDPRKLGYENLQIIITSHIKRKYTGEPIPKVRLCGDWLNDIGFEIEAIATAESTPGVITLNLQKSDTEYSALMKYVRGRKLKIIQVYKEPHAYNRRKEMTPCIGITGSCVDKAGFQSGDTLACSYENGVIKLQTLDFEKLGFPEV